MQNMLAVDWLFGCLGTAHRKIFCIFWGRSWLPLCHPVLFAVCKQPLHVPVMVPEPEQLFKSYRLARLYRPSDRLHVGQQYAVREFAASMLLQGAHRLQGLAHPTEPLIKGVHGILIGGLQVLGDHRRGVGFDVLGQAGEAYL
jgi:hypothetical protein